MQLKFDRLGVPAGTTVYNYTGPDYGLKTDDERYTGIAHELVTTNADGSGPFITIPTQEIDFDDCVQETTSNYNQASDDGSTQGSDAGTQDSVQPSDGSDAGQSPDSSQPVS